MPVGDDVEDVVVARALLPTRFREVFRTVEFRLERLGAAVLAVTRRTLFTPNGRRRALF